MSVGRVIVTAKRYFIIPALLFAFVFSAFGQTLPEKAMNPKSQSTKETAPSETKKSAWYAAYNSDMQFEIDMNSIQRNGNIIYFWEKLTIFKKNQKEYIDAQLDAIKMNYPQGIPQDIYKKWGDYKYTLTRYAIDCGNALSRGLAMEYYDNTEKIIDSAESSDPKWSPILPDTIGMEKYKSLCQYNSDTL